MHSSFLHLLYEGKLDQILLCAVSSSQEDSQITPWSSCPYSFLTTAWHGTEFRSTWFSSMLLDLEMPATTDGGATCTVMTASRSGMLQPPSTAGQAHIHLSSTSARTYIHSIWLAHYSYTLQSYVYSYSFTFPSQSSFPNIILFQFHFLSQSLPLHCLQLTMHLSLNKASPYLLLF